MSNQDGGPVFPSEQGHIPDGTWNQTYTDGMSLHQWYVGQAMSAWIQVLGKRAKEPGYYERDVAMRAAQLAIQSADDVIAMLAERRMTDE
uniref:Uncharacterized protein n=1 Tax=viral metagenome TaxID=1070528 RepID=A0A6M3JKR6_9ZZZZ